MPDPDHIHVAVAREARAELRNGASAFARWRNHHRGVSGPVWGPIPEPEIPADRSHEHRMMRYVHLNPCRAKLAADPLAWPFSTHRDAVGLAWRAARPRVADPDGFHAWVSGDPTVQVAGTPLPEPVGCRVPLSRVTAAVGSLCRSPSARFDAKTPERVVLLHAAAVLADASPAEIADTLGVSVRSVYRAAERPAHELDLVRSVVGDRRFTALGPGDLRPRWPAKYARKR